MSGAGNVMSPGQRWTLGLAGVALLAAVAVARHIQRRTALARATRPAVLGTRLDSPSPGWATRGMASNDGLSTAWLGLANMTFRWCLQLAWLEGMESCR